MKEFISNILQVDIQFFAPKEQQSYKDLFKFTIVAVLKC